MNRFRAAVVLVAGLVCSGYYVSLLSWMLYVAAASSGQISLFAPIVLGIIVLWLIASLVLFWRRRVGWSYGLAWGPSLLVFLLLH